MGWQREDHGVYCKTADGGEIRALLSLTSVTVRMLSFGWRGGTLACITKRQRPRRVFDRVVFVTGLKYPSLSSMIPITQVIYPVSISKSPRRNFRRNSQTKFPTKFPSELDTCPELDTCTLRPSSISKSSKSELVDTDDSGHLPLD